MKLFVSEQTFDEPEIALAILKIRRLNGTLLALLCICIHLDWLRDSINCIDSETD